MPSDTGIMRGDIEEDGGKILGHDCFQQGLEMFLYSK